MAAFFKSYYSTAILKQQKTFWELNNTVQYILNGLLVSGLKLSTGNKEELILTLILTLPMYL